MSRSRTIEVGEVAGLEAAFYFFAEFAEGGGLGVGVDRFVEGDFFLRLEGLGAGFVLAGDGGVEAAEGIDEFDGVVGAEGEDDVVVEEALPGVGVLDALGAEAVGGPLHVGEEMGRLHGGDDAFFFEAVEVVREEGPGRVLRGSGGRRGVGWLRLGFGDDVGVRAVCGRRRREVGDLVGYSEGVEGHLRWRGRRWRGSRAGSLPWRVRRPSG